MQKEPFEPMDQAPSSSGTNTLKDLVNHALSEYMQTRG